MKTKALILIPARYASTRFPGKPLAKIGDKAMAELVYENCGKHPDFTAAVVTDDDRIESYLKAKGVRVVRVDDDVPSGSERIFLAYKRYFADQGFDLIINVQGDEPLLKMEEIIKVASFHRASGFEIATIVKPSERADSDFHDPNKVKVAYERATGRCQYFSRAAIPFDREGKTPLWHLHIGVYSYKPEALEIFCKADASYLEQLEKLEQLRALSIGMTIGAVESNVRLMGVDTREDLERLIKEGGL